jgi:hypothetical protein
MSDLITQVPMSDYGNVISFSLNLVLVGITHQSFGQLVRIPAAQCPDSLSQK